MPLLVQVVKNQTLRWTKVAGIKSVAGWTVIAGYPAFELVLCLTRIMWPLRYSCLVSIVLLLTGVRAIGEVVYAVNCGGEAHTDVHGVRYGMNTYISNSFHYCSPNICNPFSTNFKTRMNFHQRYAKDSNRAGTESDYGRQLSIGRVPPPDQVLYQTERYHTNTFGYDIPVREDGWYLLVLKFSEVYFGAPNMKVCNTPCYFPFTFASSEITDLIRAIIARK